MVSSMSRSSPNRKSASSTLAEQPLLLPVSSTLHDGGMVEKRSSDATQQGDGAAPIPVVSATAT
jgi:hypothetical protein